jgi:hypothetical protein
MSSKTSEFSETPMKPVGGIPMSFTSQLQPSTTSKVSSIQESMHRGFKFNKILYDCPIVVKVKSPDREDFTQ